jgi:hypothetical protein
MVIVNHVPFVNQDTGDPPISDFRFRQLDDPRILPPAAS